MEEALSPLSVKGDKGLVMKTPAARHMVARNLPEVFDPRGRDFVVQYFEFLRSFLSLS